MEYQCSLLFLLQSYGLQRVLRSVEELRKLLDDPAYIKHAVESIADDLVDGKKQLSLMLRCSKCKQWKPEDDFSFCHGEGTKCRHYRNWWCRACCKEMRESKKHE